MNLSGISTVAVTDVTSFVRGSCHTVADACLSLSGGRVFFPIGHQQCWLEDKINVKSTQPFSHTEQFTAKTKDEWL